MLRPIVFLALSGLLTLAQAATMRLRAVPVRDHDPLFIDVNSIRRTGAVVDFTYVLNMPIAKDGQYSARRWHSNAMQAQMDWTKNVAAVFSVRAYSDGQAQGRIIGSYNAKPHERKPEYILEDSTFAFLRAYLCRKP